MNDKLSWAMVIAACLFLGAAGGLLAAPWVLGRKWSTSHRSMWDHRGS